MVILNFFQTESKAVCNVGIKSSSQILNHHTFSIAVDNKWPVPSGTLVSRQPQNGTKEQKLLWKC